MTLHYRTVWISDTHLGSKACRADDLAIFLKHIRCDKLYLVGDIIDAWRLKQRWYWPPRHNDVIRRILKHAKKGTEVIFIPGNHDDVLRQYRGLKFGDVHIQLNSIHETAKGKKYYICHGDEFDLVVQHSKMLAMLGTFAYEWLIVANRLYNYFRKKMGRPYYSLSQKIKAKVKNSCTFISRYEETLANEAKQRQVQGIICGHIHKASIEKKYDGIEYLNCGDWVETCSALVELDNGEIQLVNGIEIINEYLEQKQIYKQLEQIKIANNQQHTTPIWQLESKELSDLLEI